MDKFDYIRISIQTHPYESEEMSQKMAEEICNIRNHQGFPSRTYKEYLLINKTKITQQKNGQMTLIGTSQEEI